LNELRALIRKAIELRMPWRLNLRLYRWIARSAAREFPWAWGVVNAIVIAILVLLGALGSTLGIVVVALLVAWEIVLARFAALTLLAARTMRESLADLEAEWGPDRARFPLSHIIIPPLMLRAPQGVKRIRGVEFARYGDHKLRLDVYTPTAQQDEPRPAVIQVHGGGWIVGSRAEQGIPLLNHLASCGWVGFNIDYRLSPQATFPDHVVDVKRAIAWVREHAEAYGADRDFICITGGSAGGHLSALAALTAGDPDYQPGFEDADTSVAAAVPFYGVYDLTNAGGVYYPELRDNVLEPYVFKTTFAEHPERFRDASPAYRVRRDAPPFLVIHGDSDTLVPVPDARAFVERLRDASDEVVLYAELVGAEHAFDVLPSVRTARVVETIELFLETVRERRAGPAATAASAGAIG
jgi:acetyl esterase/lipase